MNAEFLKLLSHNDQDRANCDAWWCRASNAEKLLVWNRIQESHADPLDEIVSRFAQLAFTEAAERHKWK